MSWPLVMYPSYEAMREAGTPIGAVYSRGTPFSRERDGDQVPDRYLGVTPYFIVLPNKQLFSPYTRAWNPEQGSHGDGWDVVGEWPAVTITPSIAASNDRRQGGYHGWVTNGVLTDDCEGRTFP